MKKWLIASFMLWNWGIAYALPVGNPAEPSLYQKGVFFPTVIYNPCDPCFRWFDAWALRLGYYGDFVFNRNLKIRGEGLGQGYTMQKTTLTTNAGYIALSLADKLDIFGTLGESALSITTSEFSWFILGDSEGRLNWETRFSWSAGARATLFSYKGWSLGAEGQYFQTEPHLTNYVSYFDGRFNYFNENNKMKYQEWQVGAGIAYTLRMCSSGVAIVPYGAAKASWCRLHTNNFQFIKTATEDLFTIFNLKDNKKWGFALGATMTFFDRAGITAEGRWGDEKALYINGQFRF
jgi:major outer membrane protein